jgi:hypothetical protein
MSNSSSAAPTVAVMMEPINPLAEIPYRPKTKPPMTAPMMPTMMLPIRPVMNIGNKHRENAIRLAPVDCFISTTLKIVHGQNLLNCSLLELREHLVDLREMSSYHRLV